MPDSPAWPSEESVSGPQPQATNTATLSTLTNMYMDQITINSKHLILKWRIVKCFKLVAINIFLIHSKLNVHEDTANQ